MRSKRGLKKYKILKLLAQGKTQGQIVKSIEENKSSQKVLVSRYVKEFINKKWIKCVDPKTYCKTYRATPSCPSFQQKKKVNLLRSGRTTRIHNLCWKYKLLEQPRRKIHWDKVIKLKNNVIQNIIYFPLCTISLFKPSNTIYIWIKEEYTNDIKKWDEEATEHMLKAQHFLQKVLLCKLSPPVIARDPHFAKPIEDPTIMNVLKKQGILKFGEVWVDASKPGFEYGEIESTDINKLETMQKLQWSDLEIPKRMDQLEITVDKLTLNVGKMAEAQLQTTEVVKEIQNNIQQPLQQSRPKENDRNDQMFS